MIVMTIAAAGVDMAEIVMATVTVIVPAGMTPATAKEVLVRERVRTRKGPRRLNPVTGSVTSATS